MVIVVEEEGDLRGIVVIGVLGFLREIGDLRVDMDEMSGEGDGMGVVVDFVEGFEVEEVNLRS